MYEIDHNWHFCTIFIHDFANLGGMHGGRNLGFSLQMQIAKSSKPPFVIVSFFLDFFKKKSRIIRTFLLFNVFLLSITLCSKTKSHI